MCKPISNPTIQTNILNCQTHLQNSKKTKAALWVTAAVAAVVAGCIFSGLGCALFVKAIEGIAFKGIELSAFFAGTGLAMMFSGVPAGLKAGFQFVAKGWTDLTHRKVVQQPAA